MKIKGLRNLNVRRRAVASMLSLMMLLSGIGSVFAIPSADTKTKSSIKGLTENQKILHLLNRTGFGARPGDVERVKRMGIDKYLDLQLHPDRIDDSAIEARLKQFDSLNMSLAEINEKYPAPQVIARQLGLL